MTPPNHDDIKVGDWADEIAGEWADADGICCVKKHYVVDALREAYQKGKSESLQPGPNSARDQVKRARAALAALEGKPLPTLSQTSKP